MNYLSVCLVSGLLLLSSAGAQGAVPLAPEAIPGVTRITAERAVEMLNAPDVVIIDARRKPVYEKGHIEGSHSISDDELTRGALAALSGNDKARPIIFYCDGPHCLRSGKAAVKAIGFGFKRVYWLRGGWAEWTEKGLPVTK